ncbi:TonB-dependent receptor [bacterium]|nr:TonB-dependent receptor [bacterium]
MRCYIILFSLLISLQNYAQDLRQTIRGNVRDAATQSPLIGASLIIRADSQVYTTITDIQGNFTFDPIPVGRYDVECHYMGYESQTLYQQELNSAKELVLQFELKEQVNRTEAVTVKAEKDKSKTINDDISVSGRTFSIEESQRYAGSRGDVARMAQNFAGVQGSDDSRNDIVVRGNSPLGVLYRLEGVDIPNPNHYAVAGTTGGPISMLNNNVLRNSDFLSGAFPSEYGNATAAVFDLGLRVGNNQKYEFLGQMGFAGFEGMAEGPFSKKSQASFLVNYRYSALDFFNLIGLDFGTGTAIPRYQDLSFKLHFPHKKGSTSIFGLGGKNRIELFQSREAGDNLFRGDNEDLAFGTQTGMAGIGHLRRLSEKTFIRFTLATDAAKVRTHLDTFDIQQREIVNVHGFYRDESLQGKFTFLTQIQHKFNAQAVLKAGIRMHRYFFSLSDSFYNSRYGFWVQPTNFEGNTSLAQSYFNLNYRLTPELEINAGANYSFFVFNNSQVLEPRFGASYKINPRYKISMGYGLHSQVVPFRIYFEKRTNLDGTTRKINQDLGLLKSHHIVLANDITLNLQTRLKIELYYQYLFDVPVDANDQPFYSLLNQGADFGVEFTDSMVNRGNGRNYGLEITFERFLTKGLYFLNTLSLYRSFYTDANGIWHPSAFDSKYALNLLGGKEFYFKEVQDKKGRAKKMSMTTDIRFMANGGKRYTPINLEQSKLENRTVYDFDRVYEGQFQDYIRLDFRVAFKIQGPKATQEWGVDIQNITNRRNVFQRTYNSNTNEIRTTYQTGILPVGLWRIYF